MKTLKTLLQRSRAILLKEPWGKERISRSEFLTTTILCGILSFVLFVIIGLIIGSLGINEGLALVIVGGLMLILYIWLLGLIFRRGYDINVSKKSMLIRSLGRAFVSGMRFIVAAGFWLFSIIDINISGLKPFFNRTLAILMIIALIYFIITLCQLFFQKGTDGKNEYGKDPLK